MTRTQSKFPKTTIDLSNLYNVFSAQESIKDIVEFLAEYYRIPNYCVVDYYADVEVFDKDELCDMKTIENINEAVTVEINDGYEWVEVIYYK